MNVLKTKWTTFCKTLNKKDFEDAFMLKGELLKEGADADSLNLKVNTLELYTKAFAFPDVVHYDYTSEQLNTLDAAQRNLN